jgi:hypothetical protein
VLVTTCKSQLRRPQSALYWTLRLQTRQENFWLHDGLLAYQVELFSLDLFT